MMTFTGEINIENDEFKLYANQLVKRANQIDLNLSGKDEYGSFSISGIALSNGEGVYITPELDVQYEDYIEHELAVISIRTGITIIGIDSPDRTELGTHQEYTGEWSQNGIVWKFSGELHSR